MVNHNTKLRGKEVQKNDFDLKRAMKPKFELGKLGRQSKITDATLQNLVKAFIDGKSDEQSCDIAGISPVSLYSFYKENEDFLKYRKYLKALYMKNTVHKAQKQLEKKVKSGDYKAIEFTLKSLSEDYKPKQEINVNTTHNMIDKDMLLDLAKRAKEMEVIEAKVIEDE